ncbi:sialic acid synthase-like isoform X1 [Oscarella lobularis]|uniref:sialic acid synthase-like isoform X1 n=1 Tax=Oscarella lobularis TaxID=121494 RepID=UPI003313A264
MPLEFEIAKGRLVGGDHPCFVIAEIGQNHQGDIEIAKKMIRAVKEAGADCAKFQKSELHKKFNKAALLRPYLTPNSWGKTYGEHKRYLEFSHEQYHELKKFAEEVGILFTASAMDQAAADFLLDELNVPFLKVASCDANNMPYLSHVAKKGCPLVISTGMQSMDTIRQVYSTVKPINPNFTLLQCTSTYPLPPEDVHLRVISTYQKEFPDVPIGYSGHEKGISISLAAVAQGAKVLERHVTLDKTWKGSDHAASLSMDELRELITQIRILEQALGTPHKAMRPSEMALHNKLGKSVVAACDIPCGTTLTAEMLDVKVSEPKGFPPERIYELIGKKTKTSIEDDDALLEDAIQF